MPFDLCSKLTNWQRSLPCPCPRRYITLSLSECLNAKAAHRTFFLPVLCLKRSRSPSNVSDGSSDTSGSSAWSELDDEDTHWLSKAEQDKADASRRDRLHRQDGQRRGRSTTPERITSATPLNDTNVGMKMLRLMGWGGGGLGARGTGVSPCNNQMVNLASRTLQLKPLLW